MKTTHRLIALQLVCAVLATACGGGGNDVASEPPPPPPPSGPTNAERAAAATATANNNAKCATGAPAFLGSYYWEIGDKSGVLASGSRGSGVGRNTEMNIASASKLPFAAYVVEQFGLGTNREYVPYLNFTSGYSRFSNLACLSSQTVAECMNGGLNPDDAKDMFHYQGGHMQQLAAFVLPNLGNMHNAALATEVSSVLGVTLNYVSPQPPGGVNTSAGVYASFLRRLLVDSPNPLKLGPLMGSNAVCTDPVNCNASPDNEFISEPFHYSLGHWVEDNPATTPATNQAYSSAGAFGFYPWVDKDRKLYGIVAREDANLTIRQGYSSLECGRLLRRAWTTATEQTGELPTR